MLLAKSSDMLVPVAGLQWKRSTSMTAARHPLSPIIEITPMNSWAKRGMVTSPHNGYFWVLQHPSYWLSLPNYSIAVEEWVALISLQNNDWLRKWPGYMHCISWLQTWAWYKYLSSKQKVDCCSATVMWLHLYCETLYPMSIHRMNGSVRNILEHCRNEHYELKC